MFSPVKNRQYKTVGQSKLWWKELEEVVKDIETTLKNIPLTYIKQDVKFTVLTPRLLVLGQITIILTKDPTYFENKYLQKKQKSTNKDLRLWHGRYGEMNILHRYARNKI